MHCLLHLTFQSLSISQNSFFLFVPWVDKLEWSVSFVWSGSVSLTLPTFYSPVALSMCRSSRGNVLLCSPGPSLWRLGPGCNHYPLASPPPAPPSRTLCPPPSSKSLWQLAWLLLTADPTFHALCPHTHTGFHQPCSSFTCGWGRSFWARNLFDFGLSSYLVCNFLNNHSFLGFFMCLVSNWNIHTNYAVLTSGTAAFHVMLFISLHHWL